MIRDDLYTFIRRHHRDPALFSIVQPIDEVVQPRLEVSAIVWSKANEPLENLACDYFAVLRIQPVMRITQRMNIAFGSRDLTLRHFKYPRLQRCVQIAI